MIFAHKNEPALSSFFSSFLTLITLKVNLKIKMAPNVELLQQKHNIDLYHAPTGLIDAKDIGTPDAHVSRDPNITRLTGKHPLNAGMTIHVFSILSFGPDPFVI